MLIVGKERERRRAKAGRREQIRRPLLVSLQREQGETEKAACIDRLAVRRGTALTKMNRPRGLDLGFVCA
jgi:hypothetical protein